MSWQRYLCPTGNKGPFLIARLISVGDRADRPAYVDAKLDTGSPISGVPALVVEHCRTEGILLAKDRDYGASGAFEARKSPRPSYRFRVTICESPGPTALLSDRELREHFDTAHPLYFSGVDRRGKPGLVMAETQTAYALIGLDVLRSWTVILHGPRESFRVLDRPCRWFIFSFAPKPAK